MSVWRLYKEPRESKDHGDRFKELEKISRRSKKEEKNILQLYQR